MRILGRFALAAALLAPAGLITVQSASAAGGGFNCTGSSGSVVLDRGLSLQTDRSSVMTVTAPGLTCTGGQVTAGALSATLKTPAVSCAKWVGAKNVGTGTATWSAPVQMGKTTMALQFKVTATAGHVTSGTILGKVIGAQDQVGTGKGIAGTFSLNKGLKSTASGGDCTLLGRLKTFGITAINIKTTVAVP